MKKCPECLEEFLGDEPVGATMCTPCQEHYENDENQWASELDRLNEEEAIYYENDEENP